MSVTTDTHNTPVHTRYRNLNHPAAMAAEVVFLEAQHIDDIGEIEPVAVHLPGIFVQHVIHSTGGWVGSANAPGASW